MRKIIIDWIIPSRCAVCNIATKLSFCVDCLQELPWLQNTCIRCANEIKIDFAINECGECMIDPPPIDKNITLFSYNFPIDSLITNLKFKNKLAIAYALGELLAINVQQNYELNHEALPQCIVPVPLHPHRLAKRGYNQALEIAKPLKKLLNIPLEMKAIKRIKHTDAQTLIDVSERMGNIKNAFKITTHFPYKHIAILDDVMTTFTTASELAKECRRGGVEKIDFWCIARA